MTLFTVVRKGVKMRMEMQGSLLKEEQTDTVQTLRQVHSDTDRDQIRRQTGILKARLGRSQYNRQRSLSETNRCITSNTVLRLQFKQTASKPGSINLF